MKGVMVAALVACAGLAVASTARADPPDEVTIPVRIEAGSDTVSIDDVRCRRGSCEGRFAPGRHTVRRDVTDPTTGLVRQDHPCERVSDGVKVAWIGGVGVGLTLVTLGLIGYATTSGESRVTTRRWAVLPSITPARVEGRITPTAAVGVSFSF